MRHFPIFLDTEGTSIALTGGGEAAMAKLRLLMKSEAHLHVFAPAPSPEIESWAEAGRLSVHHRAIRADDLDGIRLIYAASENEAEDRVTARLAHQAGVLLNVVDNLGASQFITPAIVDRDPVTVAIGTEGAAPVLARAIKADLEERLPTSLGQLTRIGQAFRKAAMILPMGRKRRDFWRDYYFAAGPDALSSGGRDGAEQALGTLLDRHVMAETTEGHVAFVGAGPGDPELLTLKARTALDRADVVIHDRLVTPEILELARREAILIEVGKTGFGPSTPQEDINAAMVHHAAEGHHVVRLKSGDPAIFGRLDEEIDACDAEGIPWSVVPGLTAASAAVTALGQSLTKRGRNGSLRILTGHDVKGFADQDWRGLATPGTVAAIYMGKRAARFLQGRLLMHGAAPSTEISVVENASRADQRIIASTLATLPADLDAATLTSPAVLLLGLAPRAAAPALTTLIEELA